MNIERLRAYLHTLPHVVETVQFGGLVFWVGDKALGGKMFAWALLEQDSTRTRVLAYPAGPERYHELLEIEGLIPAPYLARIFWVAAEGWDVFRNAEWEQELQTAHTLTYEKLPARTRATLDLPATQQKRLINERKRLLASKPKKPRSRKKV